MKFTFNDGDITAFGIEFKQGVATEVDDEFIIGKLTGNSHFTSEEEESLKQKAIDLGLNVDAGFNFWSLEKLREEVAAAEK